MLKPFNSYAEFHHLTSRLIELILIERGKMAQLHSDYFLKSEDNYKKCHFYLITDFTLNSHDKHRQTLLHKAVENGNAGLVDLLISHYGANINTFDINGNTPLFSAIKSKQECIAKQLIRCGAMLNYGQLKRALATVNSDTDLSVNSVFNMLLSRFDPMPGRPTCLDTGLGALHLAIIKHSRLGLIRALLRNGADPNEMNKYGMTPILLATSCSLSSKTFAVLKLLFKHKADFNQASSRGLIPLNLAIISANNFDCIEFLLSKTLASSLNIVDEWECTTLDRVWYRMNNFRYSSPSNVTHLR